MELILYDLRYAARTVARNPWFTLLCVLTMALGIGANSTVFVWINATLLTPIPGGYRTSEIVSLTRGDLSESPTPPYSYLDYLDLRNRNQSFSGLLSYHNEPLGITGDGHPQRVWGNLVSANYFDVLGVRPLLGRTFAPDEGSAPGSTAVVVLSYALWQSHFGGDVSIVGRVVGINRHPFTVIGVAPQEFQGAMPAVRSELWVPYTMDPVLTGWGRIRDRDTPWLNVLGRLRPGVDRAYAQQEMNVLVQRLVQQFPNDHRGPNQVVLDPMWRSPFGGNVYFAALLPILLGMSLLVLLLACANVANLLLVRAIARRKEMAIRVSIGSPRSRIVRQLFMESFLLALGAGTVALMLTFWTTDLLPRLLPPSSDVFIGLQTRVDSAVVAATFLIAVVASVIFGLIPALRASSIEPIKAIKEEAGSVAGGVHRSRLATGLVVAQISLSLLLLVCAGLFVRSLRNAQHIDPGFDARNLLVAAYDLKPAGYSDGAGVTFDRQLLSKIESLPGVQSASLTNWLLLTYGRRTTTVEVEAYVPRPHESMEIRTADVGPNYIHTLRNPLVAGRDIAPQDTATSQPVAVVNQAFAQLYWRGEDPLGKRIKAFGGWYTVVGVAKTARYHRLDETPEPFLYLPLFQHFYHDVVLTVRTSGDAAALAPAVVNAVHELDPDLPVFAVSTMEAQVRISTVLQNIAETFVGAFGLLSLVLAAVGLYAVVAYTTRQRTHEIGIRMALGASREQVFRLVVRQGLQMTAAGLFIGLVLAAVLTRFLRGELIGVAPTDLLTYALVALLLCATAIAAVLIPAARAARVEPLIALRHE